MNKIINQQKNVKLRIKGKNNKVAKIGVRLDNVSATEWPSSGLCRTKKLANVGQRV